MSKKKKKKINKGKQSIKETSSAKKAALLETGGKSNSKPYVIISICALFVIAGAWYYFFSSDRGSQSLALAPGQSSQNVSQAQKVTYPLATFDDGKARHYQYVEGNGIAVKYFILKSSDGIVRAAFDACDVCWPSGKGYYQKVDVMVCRNCGRQFASVKINELKGGCNPAPLLRKVVGGNLVIQVKNILEGAQYFDFSRRG